MSAPPSVLSSPPGAQFLYPIPLPLHSVRETCQLAGASRTQNLPQVQARTHAPEDKSREEGSWEVGPLGPRRRLCTGRSLSTPPLTTGFQTL